MFRPQEVNGEAILHRVNTTEIYYMLEGAETLVTGGRLVNANDTGVRGSAIEGGVSRRVVPGDVVVIPGHTPHWWSERGMVDIHTQTFDLPTPWFPRSFDISVEADGRIYRFDSLVPALRSRPTDGVLDLEAVWVGTGSAADFRGRDVDGKAAFIHTLPAPGSMGHSAGDAWEGAIRRAFEGGAAAILVIYGISDNFTIWQSLGLKQA